MVGIFFSLKKVVIKVASFKKNLAIFAPNDLVTMANSHFQCGQNLVGADQTGRFKHVLVGKNLAWSEPTRHPNPGRFQLLAKSLKK